MGEYFAGPDLAGKPVAKRRDRPVGFDDGRASFPMEGVPADFSTRWTGRLLSGMAGDYGLTVSGRGGFRLFLGDQAVIDAWAPAEQSRTTVVHLGENAAVPIRLEYRSGGGPARIALRWTTPAADSNFPPALAAARSADAVVFVGGLTAQLEGEEMLVQRDGFQGGDRTKIELPEVQERLLEQVRAQGKPVVFVLLSGSAVAIPWADAHVNAILEAWYPGESGGTAVADLLLGRADPAGRLPVTFYRATADLPAFTDYRMANRTYRYFGGQPLYPFGYGLSYTRFAYANLKATAAPGTGISVEVDVTNQGGREGDEVVQFYAQAPADSHPRARESLCGFRRVHLAPGETRTVELTVSPTSLRRWDDAKDDYYIPRGDWRIAVGASSADLRQTAEVSVP